MKIAFVFDSLNIGGIETVGLNYIRLLRQRGEDITVYNLHPAQREMVDSLPEGVKYAARRFDRKLCPELYSYGVKKWWWGKFAYPILHIGLSAFLTLAKLFRPKEEYDVAIAFSGHINDLTFVARSMIRAKKKIVWCHGMLLSYLAICDGYPVLYQAVDGIVTLSDQGQQYAYAGHQFLRSKVIQKIYNPVTIKEKKTDGEKIRQLREKYGDFTLMVARVTEPKDHLSAIEAFGALKKRGIDKKLVFVGDGEALEKYKAYVKDNGLSDTCFFEGARMDVQNYVAASYIDLLSSVSEGLPTVIAEAMAFGKPCVMTDCDGGEVSGSGRYCILTKVGDPAGMADALEELYTDGEKYRRYSALAGERFRAFEPDAVVGAFYGLLGRIGAGPEKDAI